MEITIKAIPKLQWGRDFLVAEMQLYGGFTGHD